MHTNKGNKKEGQQHVDVHIKDATKGLSAEEVKEDIEELNKVADLAEGSTVNPFRLYDEY